MPRAELDGQWRPQAGVMATSYLDADQLTASIGRVIEGIDAATAALPKVRVVREEIELHSNLLRNAGEAENWQGIVANQYRACTQMMQKRIAEASPLALMAESQLVRMIYNLERRLASLQNALWTLKHPTSGYVQP
ncbi:MAG TPA: hypothetical protein VFU07_10620 [Candidatus Lumbricidophila sp.]|nr:hypothetical protein [Candidatus Lumbricidophila sp.]